MSKKVLRKARVMATIVLNVEVTLDVDPDLLDEEKDVSLDGLKDQVLEATAAKWG